MTLSSAALRKLTSLGLSSEQMAGVLEIIADGLEQEEERRRGQRERTRRSREKHAGNVTVTSEEALQPHYNPSPKKETSPTPPKEKTTPSSSEAIASSRTPRAALETVLDAERAGQVIEHRQRIRKPMTIRAAELLAGKLARCPDPNAAADAMIANGWQGFEPEWMQRQHARGSPPSQRAPSQADVFAFIARKSSNDPGQEHEDRGSVRPAIPDLSAG